MSLHHGLRTVAAILAAGAVLFAFVPAAMLLGLAETRAGRLVATAALLLICAAISLASLIHPRAREHRTAIVIASLVLITGSIFLVVQLRHQAPTGRSPDGPGLQSRFLGSRRFRRGSLTNLLPELDQAKLAVGFITTFDPWMSRAEARRIRAVLLADARALEAIPPARELGSVAGDALMSPRGGRSDGGHSYLYVPEHAPGDRIGAVVFLHGHGPNVKLMAWAWKAFADRERFAILAPSFGLGFWGEGGVEAVQRALADASSRLPIDPSRVYLAGISNGGVGVSRAASARPGMFAGLIYFSPTLIPGEIASPAFREGWRGRPILVFQGGRDHNVPPETVTPVVAMMRSQGADLTYEFDPVEDHFYFFARRAEIFERISAWMKRPID